MTRERKLATKIIKDHLQKEGYNQAQHLIIPGEVVAKMENKQPNPYTGIWKDFEIKHFKVPKVPKKFYQKYRTNMVNDAQEIARALISQNPDFKNNC